MSLLFTLLFLCCFFHAGYCFFFKQKTAYEMRISDWSSDVCSSDLQRASDDAVSWRRIATIGKAQASADAWQTNIASAQALVAQADGVLQSTSSLLNRARELTLSAASGTLNDADRATVAADLGAIADEIDGLEIGRAHV